MTLIPIEHPRRLGSPAEAEALFVALGERVVSTRGFHTTDAARIGRLVAAIDFAHDHTISFEDGTLTPAARAALEALATSRFGYLDLRTVSASLRVWPALHSWVHSSLDRAATARALATPLAPGANTVGDAQVTIAKDGCGYPVHIETRNVTTALAMFGALTDEQVKQGHLTGARADSAPLLVRFLVEIAARVHATLELDVATARALTDLYAGEPLDWQAYPVLVDFPDGRIHGFLTTPNAGERHRNKWLARIDKALRRARLG